MQANLLFNSTVNAAASHKTAQLYANTDISQLNWFEQQWVAWYLLFSDPAIATGLMSFLMHEVHFSALLSRNSSFYFIAGCLFRSLHPLDDYRCHTLLQKMEAPAYQDSDGKRAMGMHKICFILSFHGWTPSGTSPINCSTLYRFWWLPLLDLVFPSSCWILWNVDVSGTIPLMENNGCTDCILLRIWGRVPLCW